MSLQSDSKGVGAVLVTIRCFPGHIIISMSLSISRNWLCFDCCCVPWDRRVVGDFPPISRAGTGKS